MPFPGLAQRGRSRSVEMGQAKRQNKLDELAFRSKIAHFDYRMAQKYNAGITDSHYRKKAYGGLPYAFFRVVFLTGLERHLYATLKFARGITARQLSHLPEGR